MGPENITNALISECRYWQLDRLLAAMEHVSKQRRFPVNDLACGTKREYMFDISKVDNGSSTGLRLEGRIWKFVKRLTHLTAGKKEQLGFTAFGSDWQLELHQSGIFLRLLDGPEVQCRSTKISPGSGTPARQWRRSNNDQYTIKSGPGSNGWGFLWNRAQHQALHPQNLEVDGLVAIEMEVTFS